MWSYRSRVTKFMGLVERFNGFSGFPVWSAALVVSVFGFDLYPALEWLLSGLFFWGTWDYGQKKSRNFGVKPVGPVKHITPIKETSTSVVHKQLGKEGLCEDIDWPSVSQTLGKLDTSSESSADKPQSIVGKTGQIDENSSNPIVSNAQAGSNVQGSANGQQVNQCDQPFIQVVGKKKVAKSGQASIKRNA
ncbi:Hypothetical predicted protein [Olea europaea subsp. europaea]|uniref:Uncharacterized protein n=1 Tax=Olea europaea subsp. europaea TaxID=158383 RepID=A0A8S0U389_OLEEU|nr:Hypothetical predicted protein [Olea europaea subsp. europaea]